MNSEQAQKARYLRKKQAQQGYDEQEQQQQKQFKQNFTQAINNYSKKLTTKNIEQQIEYFGSIIEPFNMKQQQNMGQIDQDGFFLFKRKNQFNDAWLDSISEGNDQMIADKIKKRIKLQGNQYKSVYDADNKINQDHDQNEVDQNQNQNEDEQNDDQNSNYADQKDQNDQKQQEQQSIKLKPIQIKQLLCELLPQNKSANMFIKQLKKTIKKSEQDKQLHDKLLQLTQIYIEQTNQYDVLTKKKQQLQIQCGDDQQQSDKEVNWDEDEDQDNNNDNDQ